MDNEEKSLNHHDDFTFFWLHWVFVAVLGLFIVVLGLSLVVACGFSSCSTWGLELLGSVALLCGLSSLTRD